MNNKIQNQLDKLDDWREKLCLYVEASFERETYILSIDAIKDYLIFMQRSTWEPSEDNDFQKGLDQTLADLEAMYPHLKNYT